MSFSQQTNSFYIRGVIDPTKESTLGPNGYDFEFINKNETQEQTLMKRDYQIPTGEKWQIALTNIKYIHTSKCFSFPEASKAKTAEFRNVYDLYAIEYVFGPLKYFPIFHDKVTPWYGGGLDWVNAVKKLAGRNRSTYNWSNYIAQRFLFDMLATLYIRHYDKLAMNQRAVGSFYSPQAAPVLRANLLDVITRFGHKPSSSGWYHLTATEFVHVLNNLFDKTEIKNAEASKPYIGFPDQEHVTGWKWWNADYTTPFPRGSLWGRTKAWKTVSDAIPKFNILCDNFDKNHCGKYIRMQAKVPLSVVYIAMGSILCNICGYQKIGKTKPVIANSAINQPGRKPLSIIYNSYDNVSVSPCKMTSFTAKDPRRSGAAQNSAHSFYATPAYPQRYAGNGQECMCFFPKIPTIDGKDNDFKAFLFDKKGDEKYDYLYINAQNPLNHLNAGDIFYYTSQDSLLKWTHIGNFQSPLVTQSPSPVYGYGLSNLTTDSTKTAEIDEGTIHVDYTPEQLEFKTLTTNELLNFNVDPRNAYGDKVHIPYTIMEFLIKRVR